MDKISWIQQRLDILRKMLNLQTRIERLQTEAMVRGIASHYQVDADTLVAVLKCESGLNPKTINVNKNGTTDYGLCQFNDYWYRDKISPDVALNHPEVAVNVMCRAWEAGRANDWTCYRTKRYIQFYDR